MNFQTRLALLCGLLLLPMLVQAQRTYRKMYPEHFSAFGKYAPWEVGFRMGAGVSNWVGSRVMYPDRFERYDAAFSPVVGLVANGSLGRHGGVQAEVLYTQRGSRHISHNRFVYQQVDTRQHWVEMPILARGSLLPYKSLFRPFVVGGLSFGTLLGAKEDFLNITREPEQALIYTERNNENVSARYDRVQVGLQVGAGIHAKISKTTLLQIEARAYRSAQPLISGENSPYSQAYAQQLVFSASLMKMYWKKLR